MSRSTLSWLLAALILCSLPVSIHAQKSWEPVGPGGGGSLYVPSISPVDPDLIMEGCDMSGAYRSENGGLTWQTVDFNELTTYIPWSLGHEWMCPFAWHPQDANVVFVYGSKLGATRLYKSVDKGKTWSPALTAATDPWRVVTQLAIDRTNPDFMLAGTNDGAYRSTDGGKTWTVCKGVAGYAVGLMIDQNSPAGKRTCYVGTNTAAYISQNQGADFEPVRSEGTLTNLASLAGGSLTTTGRTVVYAAAGGLVYRSVNGGSWSAAGSDDCKSNNFLAVADNTPDVAYVSASDTYDGIYKTVDSGKTWKKVFNPSLTGGNVDLGWIHYDGGFKLVNLGQDVFPALGLGVNPANPDMVMLTNGMESIISTNGGDTWQQDYSVAIDPAPRHAGQRWASRGLEVTGAWFYQINPSNPQLHYIAYTDICYARSMDAGLTWIPLPKPYPTHINTFYQLAFDPSQPKVVYAAMSDQHDIPHKPYDAAPDNPWSIGSVFKSTDEGATWFDSSNGLPLKPKNTRTYPITSIISDTSTKPATLYAAVWGGGVYKSVDSAANWTPLAPISIGENKHTYFLKLHKDGTLFCVLGPRIPEDHIVYKDPGGLFRSRDKGKTWENITEHADTAHGNIPFYCPIQMDVDPKNSNIIYLATNNGQWSPLPGHFFPDQGGVYKTIDGGKNWKRLTLPPNPAGYDGISVIIDPTNTQRVYFTTENIGLYVSENAGKSWQRVTDIPFASIQRVAFDTAHKKIFVGTNGNGVWRKDY